MNSEGSKLKKSLLLEWSDEEWALLNQLALVEETEMRNVFRRAIRERLEAKGVTVPEGLFTDRRKGNRLPKSEPQTEVKPLGSHTGMRAVTLIPA